MKLAEIILKGPFQLFVDSYLSFEHCFYQYCAQKFARKFRIHNNPNLLKNGYQSNVRLRVQNKLRIG